MARLLCVSPRRVQQLAKEGVIPKAQRGEYPLVPCVQGYIRYLQDEARQGANGSPEMAEVKTRLARAKAEREELKVREIRKELVRAKDVIEAWSEILHVFRTRMRAIPSRVAPRVRTAKTDGKAAEVLRTEIDRALDELARADVQVVDPGDGDRDTPGDH